MARKVRPWWRSARQEWFARVDGKQVPLGVTDPGDEAAAFAAFQALLARLKAAPPPPAARAGPVAALVEPFLAAKLAEGCAPRTVANYRWHLARFAAHFGACQVAALDCAAVQTRAAGHGWSGTHTANHLSYVEMFLRWAGWTGPKLKKPPKDSRGADSVIPEPVYRLCLRETAGDFRQVLRFLWHTGARPGEAAALTADAADLAGGVCRVRRHKTRHRGKTRNVYLDAEAAAVVREQVERYAGAGLLFRGMRGRAFSRQAYVMRFERLSEKVGHKVRSYDFRHSFATRALVAGVPDATVAALLGHCSTAMLHKHYSHLNEMARHLRDAAARVGGEKPAA